MKPLTEYRLVETLPPNNSMTSATPRPAPLVMPKMDGPASGLRKAVCSNKPLTASALPLSSAVSACGKRFSNTIKCHESFADPSPVSMRQTSDTGILTDPVIRFKTNRSRMAAASKTIFL